MRDADRPEEPDSPDSPDYPEEFDRLLDEAAGRMDEEAYEEALPLLQEAARLVPDDPEVWQRLGTSYFGLGQDDRAEGAYRRWWELMPGNPLAFRAYANLLFRLGRLEEAEAAALAWLGREPDDPYAALLLANARYKVGEVYETWLERAREADPELFAQVLSRVFDYTRGPGPGDWSSREAADYLGIPETRLIERAARGDFPRYYDPETEVFTFRRDDLDARREMLERYGVEDADEDEPAVEIDYGVDIDDLDDGEEVRILLQKCPHCGEWTAGPIGDRERYFCCGEPMDPFVELSSELEIRGRVVRRAGGGRELSERIARLTPEQRSELRDLWLDERNWAARADEIMGLPDQWEIPERP